MASCLSCSLERSSNSFAVLFSANLETFVKHAADSDSWTKPAQGFSENLAFVDPDDPSRPMNYRPPVYPLFVGFFMIVAGSLFPMFVVLIQLLLHFATSFVTARIVEYVEPGMGQPLGTERGLFSQNGGGAGGGATSEVSR